MSISLEDFIKTLPESERKLIEQFYKTLVTRDSLLTWVENKAQSLKNKLNTLVPGMDRDEILRCAGENRFLKEIIRDFFKK
jgi:hypothetical protein